MALAPRFHVAAALASGLELELPVAVARHVQVLRLQPGAPLVLFNGDDGAEWAAEVIRMGKASVVVRLGAPAAVDRELPWQVTIAVGMPANDRMDALVEKACELGAAAIQPLICERSVLRLAGERAEAKRRHWAGVAASASEQCGRVRVASVLPVRGLLPWLDDVGRAHPGPLRLVLSLAPEAIPPAATFEVPRTPAAAAQVLVLSGPEGGLSPAEEAAAATLGFTRTRLGPRVLRADTAPLALLAWLGLAADAQRRS